MKKIRQEIAIARDGKQFIKADDDYNDAYIKECREYEDQLNRELVARVIGHVRFFSRMESISRLIQLEGRLNVFCEYEDVYVRILDEEGVALANEYCTAMTDFVNDSISHPANIFTINDIGKTVRLYYNEGRGNRWSRYNETLEELIVRHQKTLEDINKYSTDPIFNDRLFVKVEGVYE